MSMRLPLQGRRRPGDDPEDRPRPFLEHLTDLRRCVIHCAAAWLGATLLVAPWAPRILALIMEPLRLSGHDPDALVRGQRLGSGFSVLFQIMLWGGVLLSLPLLFLFIAQFVFPGLRPNERRAVRSALLGAGALFILGVALCFRQTMPLAVDALFRVNAWMGVEIWPLQLEDYVNMVVKTLLAFGLAFQLPLALLALGWTGILPARLLRAKRRHAVVVIAVLAMILTPPDPVSMLAMALPLYLFYEVCILLIATRERARRHVS